MTNEDAFLRAIVETPDDDNPRLQFADWLEERGRPGDVERAEFIRVQCRLADLDRELMSEEDCLHPDCPGCVERRKLRRREQELWLDGRAYWGAKLPSVIGDATNEFSWWRRGFVEEVCLPLAAWLQHGVALVQVAPLRVVRLSDFRPEERSVDGHLRWLYPPHHLLGWYPAEVYFFSTARGHYYTEADALVAMSRCCLDWAHSRKEKP